MAKLFSYVFSGCILAELLTGYPLLPGEDEGDQLACMIELLGMPPQVRFVFLENLFVEKMFLAITRPVETR